MLVVTLPPHLLDFRSSFVVDDGSEPGKFHASVSASEAEPPFKPTGVTVHY